MARKKSVDPMAAPARPGLDQGRPGGTGQAAAGKDPGTRAATSPARTSEDPKCPELRDLLGDYSEQTGSFFG